MTLKHFIERPVLASVISILIVIAGILGLATLPVEQYPDIAPPTVMVHASYPGASAETIQKSVVVPLEEAINGVENMTYISSSAAVGSASISVYFRQGTDPDMAAVNVQNKVATATGQLPSEVTQIGVTTMKRQTSMVKIFSLYSPDDSYDETFLANYLKINIEPRILRIQGVGEPSRSAPTTRCAYGSSPTSWPSTSSFRRTSPRHWPSRTSSRQPVRWVRTPKTRSSTR